MHMHIYIHTYIHTYIYIYIKQMSARRHCDVGGEQKHICMYMYLHTYISTFTYTYIYSCTHINLPPPTSQCCC